MSYQNSGTVTTIDSKEFDGRNGPVLLWSFQIDGSRRWFRLGRKRPTFQKGESISFENDEKGNVDFDSIVAGGAPAAPLRQSGAPRAANNQGGQRAASNSGGGQTRDGYWAEKEARDLQKDKRYQEVDVPRMSFSAAQDRAVTLVAAALSNDALSLGQKKGERLDLLLEYVDQVTDRFFTDSMNAHTRLKEIAERGPSKASTAEDDLIEEEFLDDWP